MSQKSPLDTFLDNLNEVAERMSKVDDKYQIDKGIIAPGTIKASDENPLGEIKKELQKQNEVMSNYASEQKAQHEADDAQRLLDSKKSIKIGWVQVVVSIIFGSVIGSIIASLFVLWITHRLYPPC